MQPGLHIYADDGALGQAPFDVAVVMPSLLRPSLFHALQSIFAQKGADGKILRIQVMIGVDRTPPDYAVALLERACAARPSHCVVSVLWPGYSTSQRHGGLGRARDGGVLRSVLSQLANAPRIAYLDDDNWWAPNHLASLLEAIDGGDWAWSGRHFVHPKTLRPICEDLWESVGPGGGVFRERYGGFVDPNCLMLDRARVPEALDLWNQPMPGDETYMTADRRVFDMMRHRKGRPTGDYTAYYVLTETDGMHPFRLQCMGDAWHEAGRIA